MQYQMLEEDNGRVKASTILLTIEDPIYPEDYQNKKSGELAADIPEIIQNRLKSTTGEEQSHTEERPIIQV